MFLFRQLRNQSKVGIRKEFISKQARHGMSCGHAVVRRVAEKTASAGDGVRRTPFSTPRTAAGKPLEHHSEFTFLKRVCYTKSGAAQTINHFKDNLCLAGRRTQNEKTLHADLLIAGIAQLISVMLAEKIHQRQFIRSLKPLVA